ncbi:MAG: response regulator transcription factor [Candidatus Omnitrophica bacterium]|nr:response regulator transcription factor [Candidatus Omnitrophota bacterium]
MTDLHSIIYVVDDDVSMGRALALLLRSYGFNVEVFIKAADFLSFKHPKVPSCLLLDIRLPDIDGLVLQEKMVQQGIGIPIIFITGHGDVPKSVKAIKAGAIDFFIKPFTTAKLLDAIALALVESKSKNKKQAETAKIWRNIKTLSPRELEVFRLVVSGMLNKQIATKRGTALQTIKVHRSRVMQKMQAKTVTELIRMASKAGITSLQD